MVNFRHPYVHMRLYVVRYSIRHHIGDCQHRLTKCKISLPLAKCHLPLSNSFSEERGFVPEGGLKTPEGHFPGVHSLKN